MVLVRGRAPHDPSQRTTLADPRLPKDFALLVGIQRVDDAGFLPDNQHTLSAAQASPGSAIGQSRGPDHCFPDSWSCRATKQEVM